MTDLPPADNATDLPPADDATDSPSGDVPRDLDAPAVPFLKRRHRPRRQAESAAVRLVATCGIVGIAVALAAILGTQDVAAWIIGLVISLTSVILAALLWSSRTL
jgi:4'-phosphopantetheinyl transferase EntD